MKLYMFSKLLCTYFPSQRHNTPAYAIHTEVQGEAQAESQAQQSQDQHHSTPGWALPRAVSEMIIHLRTSYGLHTNHQIQLGEDDFWDILGMDFDVKICKLYRIVFIVVFRCTVLLLLHVSCQFNSTIYFHISLFTLLIILFVCLLHFTYLITPYFFSLSQWPLHGPMALAETRCGASQLHVLFVRMWPRCVKAVKTGTVIIPKRPPQKTTAWPQPTVLCEILRFIGMRCQCESMFIDVYTSIFIYIHLVVWDHVYY